MVPSPNSEPFLFPLPQYGFGPDSNFKTLVPDNPFLYRVYTPKERSPFSDETDPYFVAPKFDEVYARTPVEVTSASIIDPLDASYADIAAHMEWTTRSKSPFLSVSFSFAWSIWEAVRRYHQGMKKDVEIAIIDASAMMGRAATAVQLLRKSSAEERNSQYAKWYRFALESQSVLIHGLVPGNAVLASIPLLAVIERLPPYYLRSKTLPSPGKPLDHLGWNYVDKKHNYRQFCQEITNRFFAQSQEMRFRDATGGSMRLALTVLRPWFHRMVTQDFKVATKTLRSLAIIIAHWGGQWWAKEHSELNRILDTMANTLGEELLQRFEREDKEEIHRLQDTVDTLERVIRRHETNRLSKPRAGISKGECCSTPITPESSPKVRPRRTLSMSMPMPSRDAANVQTPITPPESPRHSQIFSRNVDFEYLPTTIAFQPFTPPVDWPSLPVRSPALSLRSSISRPTTPPGLRSILSPVAEVLTPAEGFPPEEDLETKIQQILRTPMASRRQIYLPSPESTPPVTLDSLTRDGFRARTISDLATGLRIEIPGVARQLIFSPSPTEGFQPNRPRPESMESSLTTLAPPSPPAILEKSQSPVVSKLLGSPIAFTKELEELPPLPASPTHSWGSVSTLPSRPPSPQVKPALTRDLPTPPPPTNLTLPLSLRSTRQEDTQLTLVDSPIEPKKLQTLSRSSSTTSLSEYLVTPTDVKPQRGEICYRVPRPPVSILSSLAVAFGEYEEAERRARQSPVFVETGAFIVTGFLVGAFVTLFLISTQRRSLLSLT